MKLPQPVGLPSVHPYLTNKYTQWYYGIIHNASLRQHGQSDTIYHSHHIIPECMFASSRRSKSPGNWPGDPDSISNLVSLTVREHIICHWLLTKMVSGRNYYKMEAALYRFKSTINKGQYTANTLELARIIEAHTLARRGAKSWVKDGEMVYQHTSPGAGWIQTNLLHKQTTWVKDGKQVFSATCPGEGWINTNHKKGHKHWIKDGVEVSSPTCPGEGWTQGVLKKGVKIWFKDGAYKQGKTSPGEGWIEQGNQKGKKRWHKDGKFKMSFECPGPDWERDTSKKGKLTWIKDGTMKFSFECPGEGWIRGHLKTGIKQLRK